MSSAIIYPCICLVCYLIAIPLRKYKEKLGWFGKAQTISVLCLVFAMGIRVGANEEVVHNLDTYGLYSLIFTIVVLVFSVIAIHFARKIIGLDRQGLAKARRGQSQQAGGDGASVDGAAARDGASVDGAAARDGASVDRVDDAAAGDGKPAPTGLSSIFDKMTIMILISVAAGLCSGYFYFLKHYDFEQVSAGSSLAISIGLIILLIFVGLDLGLEGNVVSNIRQVGFKVLILPVSVAIGTLFGALLCAIFLPLAVNESLAIGSGFAWYSLGAGIIMDAGFEVAGAISFLHNVMRELFSIVFVPFVAKKFGYAECLGLPASVGMDVCLPIVEQSTNGATTVYSFINGFTLSMSVPFLVPLFLSI